MQQPLETSTCSDAPGHTRGPLAVAAVRSIAAYVVISLYVLIAAPAGMLLAWLTRSRRVLYVLGYAGVQLGITILGLEVRTTGRRHILAGRAAVYCSNHASNLEPPILYAVLRPLFPNVRILYKAELQKLPILPHAFQMAGFVPIERSSREQSMHALEVAAQGLREGASFLIFPEGTRSPTGELLPFKKGGFLMAIRGQVPVVPIAVQGARTAMRKGSPFVRPVTVSVRIGPPIETAGMTEADRGRLIEMARSSIKALLAQGPIREPGQ